jgi:hypothetical protein
MKNKDFWFDSSQDLDKMLLSIKKYQKLNAYEMRIGSIFYNKIVERADYLVRINYEIYELQG